MSATTSIEWTDKSWNPVRGCALVSPGCTNCYAMKFAHRFSGAGKPYDGLTRLTKHGPVWTGEALFIPWALEEPFRWKKPQRVFVNSMSDLFHEDVTDEQIAAVFGVMAAAPQHTFQILTKRPERMRAFLREVMPRLADDNRAIAAAPAVHQTTLRAAVEYLGKHPALDAAWERDREARNRDVEAWPLRNVWIGVSVEDQARANERIPLLLDTPAAVRWVSAEPLLERVSLADLYDHAGGIIKPLCGLHWQPTPASWSQRGVTVLKPKGPTIDWVVVGGESGPGARPFHLDWARKVVADCKAAGVPCFVKQLGAVPVHTPPEWGAQCGLHLGDRKGGDMAEWPEELRVRQYPEGSRP
ncbi:MAG: phage Gp37/Gp68 family protein [Polyangiaceae bacterium]